MILFNFYIQRLEFGVIFVKKTILKRVIDLKQLAFGARKTDSDFGIILLTKRYV